MVHPYTAAMLLAIPLIIIIALLGGPFAKHPTADQLFGCTLTQQVGGECP